MPRTEAGKRVLIDPAPSVIRFPAAHLAAQARQFSAIQPHQTREHPEAEKGYALAHGRHESPFLPQLQPQALPQKHPDRRQGAVQSRLVLGKHGEIIHIANVAREAQPFLDEMVQFSQVPVGKVLAGQVADRHSLAGAATPEADDR